MVALYRENILMFVNFAKKYLELHKYQLYLKKKKIRHIVHLLFVKKFHVNKFATCNCNCNKKCILIQLKMNTGYVFLKFVSDE